MKKMFKRMSIVMVVLFVLSMLTACGPGSGIEIAGHWKYEGDGFTTEFEVTETTIKMYDTSTTNDLEDTSYEFEIVSYDNDKWLTDDNDKYGNRGCVIVKYTKAPSWNTGAKDKFTEIRWKDLDSNKTFSYQEGYTDPYPATKEEAEKMAFENGFTDKDTLYTKVTLQPKK